MAYKKKEIRKKGKNESVYPYSEKQIKEWLKRKIDEMNIGECARMLADTFEKAPLLREKLAEEPEEAIKIGAGCIKAGLVTMGRNIIQTAKIDTAKIDIPESRAVELAKIVLRAGEDIETIMSFYLRNVPDSAKMQFLHENWHYLTEDSDILWILERYLRWAFGEMETTYLHYHIPGGLASSGKDVSCPVNQIPGTNIKIVIRKEDKPHSYFQELVEKGLLAKGYVEIKIIKGVRSKWVPGKYGGGKTYDVNYGILLGFHPEKEYFMKGKAIMETFETSEKHPINLETDKDLSTVINTLQQAGIRIVWWLKGRHVTKSEGRKIGDYEIE
ncbi:hypothetical protein J7J39_02145 [bacterium]|nr:hypothetical protein [bacterium]